MATSKITHLMRQDSEWEAHGKKFYDYEVRMEDGTCGQCSSTDPVHPPYKVGEVVDYEQVQSNWGVKLKIKRQQDAPRRAPQGNPRGQEVGVQWAINAAITILGDTPHLPAVESTAELLLKMRDDILARMR
jgi:hypothetical protein